MIIRVLPHLDNRDQWIAFCRREAPYCFVETPDTLVDFQSNHLIITLLDQQVRNGKEAIKFSIGSRSTIEPAWRFIKACQFNLTRMVEGLKGLEFEGNARDNADMRAFQDVGIRRFFAKERSLISPAFLGTLEPLYALPDTWDIHACCRLLANDQFRALRNDSPTNSNNVNTAPPDPAGLLLALVERPDQWQSRQQGGRLYIYSDRQRVFSLVPDLSPPPQAHQRIA